MDNNELNANNSEQTYCYIRTLSKLYWVEKWIFFSVNDACNNLMLTSKDLKNERENWFIQDYDWITYRIGEKKGCLNLLNEDDILKPSNNPIIDEDIKKLIENVAWYKQENIEYLHKAILYKYSHINDFSLSCIVFAWRWWSWKWTFISLLWTIFWEKNTMPNLGQRELTSSFDTYKWLKLVVEFAEVITNNVYWDKKILNKLKNIIGAEKITVNEKGVQPYQIENIAWFFISSNSNKPIQLDDKDKGNRRFSIIISDYKLENGERINQSIRNKEKASNYLAWLMQKYPEVLKLKKFEALDNQDKKDLEERSQEEANSFWDWTFENYPNFRGKKTIKQIADLINEFCIENNLNENEFKRFFWNNSKYPKKKIRVWDKTFYGVELPENAEHQNINKKEMSAEDYFK